MVVSPHQLFDRGTQFLARFIQLTKGSDKAMSEADTQSDEDDEFDEMPVPPGHVPYIGEGEEQLAFEKKERCKRKDEVENVIGGPEVPEKNNPGGQKTDGRHHVDDFQLSAEIPDKGQGDRYMIICFVRDCVREEREQVYYVHNRACQGKDSGGQEQSLLPSGIGNIVPERRRGPEEKSAAAEGAEGMEPDKERDIM